MEIKYYDSVEQGEQGEYFIFVNDEPMEDLKEFLILLKLDFKEIEFDEAIDLDDRWNDKHGN